MEVGVGGRQEAAPGRYRQTLLTTALSVRLARLTRPSPSPSLSRSLSLSPSEGVLIHPAFSAAVRTQPLEIRSD